MNRSKILVVFFSHAGENYSVGNVKVGNTKLVADEIQKHTGADVFEVVAEKSYDMPYSQLIEVARDETRKGEKPAFKGEVKNMEQYDTVFIGGPVWWGTYPQVMFTFFDRYDLNGKTIIPFTTHEGSGLANTVEDVKRAYPKAKVMEGFAVYGHEVRKSMRKVDQWLKGLGLAAGKRSDAQSGSVARETDSGLAGRRQTFVAMAAMEAKGDTGGLKAVLDDGFDKSLTVSEAKEVLSHLYAYTGFPRSLNALNVLQQVIREREERGLKTEKGVEADALPAGYDALKTGTAVQTQLTGGRPFDYSFAPQMDYYLKAHLFGDIFSRNNLSFADRELTTIGALSALPGCESQLLSHVSGSRNMGVKDEELLAIAPLLRLKVGEAEGNRVERAVGSVLDKPVRTVETVDFNVWPKGEPNTAYAKYFIGNSYLADMDSRNGGPHNVTFEPGCRNNWHIHHKSVQVLVCVAGRGWYQEWGKPAVALTPGMVITVPEGVKHWHGAARDAWFQHLAYTAKVEEGAANEWLEPVTDDIYYQLK